jgi:hypothetical protein
MDYVKQTRRVFKSLSISYRGFRGEKQPDGSIRVGDCFYPNTGEFIKGINDVCEKRYEFLQSSIERAEKKLNQQIK